MTDQCCKTPKADLLKDALEHYGEASASILSYSNSIPKALNHFYKECYCELNHPEDVKYCFQCGAKVT